MCFASFVSLWFYFLLYWIFSLLLRECRYMSASTLAPLCCLPVVWLIRNGLIMAPCGQNSKFSVSLRYSKGKPSLKALYGPIVFSSSTSVSSFIPLLPRKFRNPSNVVSCVILPRYIHAHLFSALISLSLDVPIMTCCRCLLRFRP